jgi:hypothetical protein
MSSMEGSAVRLVEPAHRVEHVAAYGPESAPEGGCFPATVLMHPMVEEVLVAGDDVAVGRIVVVGTEQRRHIGRGDQVVLDRCQGLRMHPNIGVHEDQHVAARRFGAHVPAGGGSTSCLVAGHESGARLPRRVGGVIGRRVVDHQQFVGGTRRGRQRFQTYLKIRAAIAHGDDD